jgi:hypothetical protein
MPAERRRGAAGMDIEAMTLDSLSIVGELKTTKPYQPGFGAQQRKRTIVELLRDSVCGIGGCRDPAASIGEQQISI